MLLRLCKISKDNYENFEIYYNLVRKYQSIKKTLSELTTYIKLISPNKWLGLIEKSY